MKKKIAILGSTGSVGMQALEVISSLPDAFSAEVLTAWDNHEALITQAIQFMPNAVVIGNKEKYGIVADALNKYDIKVFAGEEAIIQIVEMETVDLVLAAIVGFAGLRSTLKAIEFGKPVALANKETLVVAGNLITELAREKGVNIYPVDSEHSAIFQCLAGEFHNPVEKVMLTGSGGPFRGKGRAYMEQATAEQALNHPVWAMGNKITIDSATLMNKGLEVIEAHWLFNLAPDQIEVVIHPQSIIHSMVQFVDGSVKAQLGLPDMKLPLQYAFSYPARLPSDFPRFRVADYPLLTFEKPDSDLFPCLGLAYHALRKGGNMPCILNAANEVAVHAFLENKISFLQISEIILKCMDSVATMEQPGLDDYILTDKETRMFAQSILNGGWK
jgi:1-deoxy-D-xylulose-5-phosphate reductoisomerase